MNISIEKINNMIQKEKDHIEWLKSKRINFLGGFFFPNHNLMIDNFIRRATTHIDELESIKHIFNT